MTETTRQEKKEDLVIAAITDHRFPESAEFVQMTPEQRVRLAWRYYREYEEEVARLRKGEATRQRCKKIPKSDRTYSGGGTGRSINQIAAKVGLKATTFYYAEKVVKLADELRATGDKVTASYLLNVLNSRSVNAAAAERRRILEEREPQATEEV